MSKRHPSRRDFLKTSAVAAAATTPLWFHSERATAFAMRSPNERPVLGCIGTGDRWGAVGPAAMHFADCVAVCDVDAEHVGHGKDRVKDIQTKRGVDRDVAAFEDYRKVLDRKDIEVVTIVTPDHWHSKIAIEAMLAGKDVYCEKPLTLTIDEGKQIIKVLDKTKRVFQVGTQQRTEMAERFLKAVALVREGRIGKLQTVTCAIGGAPSSGELPKCDPPTGLNWDMWLGQTPLVDYVSGPKPEKGYAQSRTHYEFRWWYEYSGGKMTDWGAHHVDIAQWAAGMENSGPVSIEGTAEHPNPLKNGWPTNPAMYNAATKFRVMCKFPNGVELIIRDDTENGITFEGSDGKFFVSRGELKGEAVDALKEKPLPDDCLTKLLKGKKPGNHMANFFECIPTRDLPASDVYTHHRAMTTCHLANIAIRLGRPLVWDPAKQEFVGDKDARTWQAREQRKGYEIVV